MQRDLPAWEEPLQTDAGIGIHSALSAHSLPSTLLPALSRVTMTLLATWSPSVHETWLPVFSLILTQLSLTDVESICVPVVLSMGEPSQTVQTRTLACSLIGELSAKLGGKFKGEVWNRTRLLSQDPHFEVRKQMAMQLTRISIAVDKAIRPLVLEEVSKLLVDDEIEVSRAAADHLEPLLDFCDSSILSKVLAEELIHSQDEFILLSLAKISGKLLQSTLRLPNSRFSSAIYDFYKSLIQASSPALQLAGATNFPLIFKSHLSAGAETELTGVLERLAGSQLAEVRVATAQGLHEVLPACSRPQGLHHLVVNMLADPATMWEVAEHLAVLYDVLRGEDNKGFWQAVQPLLSPIHWWRHVSSVLREIAAMRAGWKIREILDFVQPNLMNLLRDGCWTLRLQALDLLVALLHDNFYKARRVEMCQTVAASFGQAASCFMRLLYVEFCLRVVKTHSKAFFETYFFQQLLELKRDGVVCVRIRLAEVLPRVGKVFSGEEAWSSEVSEAVTLLSTDSDPEVRQRAFTALKEMGQKEYWEAARVVEAEEMVKLARETAQDEMEMAVRET